MGQFREDRGLIATSAPGKRKDYDPGHQFDLGVELVLWKEEIKNLLCTSLSSIGYRNCRRMVSNPKKEKNQTYLNEEYGRKIIHFFSFFFI